MQEDVRPQTNDRAIETADSGLKVRRRETPHHHKNNKVISLSGRDITADKLMTALSQAREPPLAPPVSNYLKAARVLECMRRAVMYKKKKNNLQESCLFIILTMSDK